MTPPPPAPVPAPPGAIAEKPKSSHRATSKLRLILVGIGAAIFLTAGYLSLVVQNPQNGTSTSSGRVTYTAYSNSTYNVSLNYPSHWTVQSYMGEPVTLVAEFTSSLKAYDSNDVATFPAHVRVAKDNLVSGETLDLYAKRTLDDYGSQVKEIRFQESTDGKIAGVAAKKISFLGIQKDESQMPGVAVAYTSYIFVKNGKGYEVSYITLPESVSTHRDLVEKMVSSVSVK